jgi:hypothetical protein
MSRVAISADRPSVKAGKNDVNADGQRELQTREEHSGQRQIPSARRARAPILAASAPVGTSYRRYAFNSAASAQSRLASTMYLIEFKRIIAIEAWNL